MMHTIYIEREVAEHPRVAEICQRFPDATRIPCERYGEVFNPKAQNFRLQKGRPALILAHKHAHHVLETPPHYGVGGERNWYFSHLLNCIYDCRYCFLQGMYRSAHYVLFVNYEDFQDAIEARLEGTGGREIWFFSGYDCDSLALEPVTGFAEHFLPFFADHPTAWLELRTKSTQVRSLLHRHQALPNCVVAFSFTPAEIARALEHKVPSVERRLDTMARLQERGWTLGLRFDPLIYDAEYRERYRGLFVEVFGRLRAERLHSVSMGSFRLPKGFYRNLVRLYPTEPLFASPLEESAGMVAYRRDLEREMLDFCTQELLSYIPESIFYPCTEVT